MIPGDAAVGELAVSEMSDSPLPEDVEPILLDSHRSLNVGPGSGADAELDRPRISNWNQSRAGLINWTQER